jgi:putative transposase
VFHNSADVFRLARDGAGRTHRLAGPRLTDDDRCRLAARAYPVGGATLREISTIATPDTLLRWHRRLIASTNGPPDRRVGREVEHYGVEHGQPRIPDPARSAIAKQAE